MSDLFNILQKHEKAQDVNRPTKGIVQSVDGNRVNILVRGSSTILHSVKAIGTATVAGQEAILTWEGGTPTAHIVGGTTEPSSLVAFSRGPQGPQGLVGPEGPAGAQGPAGADGVSGADGAQFRGDWNSETAYLVGEIVRHIGASWGCVEANTGQEPYHPTGPTPVYWVCLGTVETNYSRAAWIHNLTTWALSDDDELVAVGSTTHGAYTAYQHSNKFPFGSLKSALQTFFETLFAPLSHGHSENILTSGLSEWGEQAETPTTPAADKHKVYFKSDDRLYKLNDAGQEVEVGAGSGISGDADTLDGYHADAFALVDNGVTGGDSHDHTGGDGGQIDHINLANKGTNTHAQIDTHLAAAAPHSGHALLSHSHLVETCTAYNSTTVSVPSGAWTTLPFNGDLSDAPGWHNPASNNDKFYLTIGGEYLMLLQNLFFTANATGMRAAAIMDALGNSVGTFYMPAISGDVTWVPVIGQRPMTSSYVYARVYQNSGVTLLVSSYYKLSINRIN